MSYIMNKGLYMHNCKQLFRVNEKGMNVHDYLMPIKYKMNQMCVLHLNHM